MSLVTRDKYQKSLSDVAKIYAGLGYSVLPIRGDTCPEKAKAAAVNWKSYQQHRPSDEQINKWFEVHNYAGLAIVTGRISNLIVIDFDSITLQQAFERQFPDLLDTRIVTSANRGLSHYYYALPFHLHLATCHIDGADLLSDGCYVIAPPTIIDNKAYRIQHGGMPYRLTAWDVKRLKKFFDDRRNILCNISSTLEVASDTPTASPDSLVHLYRHYAPNIGRNNALFKVACHARDHHLNAEQVKATLQDIHARQITTNPHVPETLEERLLEAEKTIHSAFHQPPRPPRSTPAQLPNSVREALLKQGLTCVARVLDGLFLKGFKPGALVTKKLVTETLRGQVGRHSILTTFDAVIGQHHTVFEAVDPPPGTPSHTPVAHEKAKNLQTKCFMFSQSKPDKTVGGRIPTYYRMPDINVLCDKLGVPFTRSDPLSTADIQGAKTYRQAVHRELIKRRPGMYHRRWLAERLGVSRRTCQRYDNTVEKIQRQPMFIYERITWKNLHWIPADEPISGRFLEDQYGKRYPGLQPIAARLLANKQAVRYGYQDVNYYWYDDNLPFVEVRWGMNPRQDEVDQRLEKIEKYLIQQYWKDFHAKKHVQSQSASSTHHDRPHPAHVPVVPSGAFSQGQSKTGSPHLSSDRADRLARRLYQTVWDKATGKKSRLSRINARQLVDQYGEKLIHRALDVLKRRKNINNPAGFIVVWLRSTAKGMR